MDGLIASEQVKPSAMTEVTRPNWEETLAVRNPTDNFATVRLTVK